MTRCYAHLYYLTDDEINDEMNIAAFTSLRMFLDMCVEEGYRDVKFISSQSKIMTYGPFEVVPEIKNIRHAIVSKRNDLKQLERELQ